MTGDLFATGATTVVLSVLLHGLTASPAAKAYGARMQRLEQARGAGPEHRPAFAFATRFRWHGVSAATPRHEAPEKD